MATTTSKYNLVKPALTDAPPDITVMNPNWDTIDLALPLNADKTIYVSTTGNNSTGTGASNAPYRTITHALSTIPKNLGGHVVTLQMGAGTYSETVEIYDFGQGRIMFSGGSSTVAITVTGFDILNCGYVQFSSTINLTVGSAGMIINNNSLVIMTGNLTVAGASVGLIVNNNASFTCSVTSTFNSCTTAVRVSNGSAAFGVLAGTGNTTGLSSVNSGRIGFSNSANLTATTKFNTSTGGRIYSGAQASIPSY